MELQKTYYRSTSNLGFEQFGSRGPNGVIVVDDKFGDKVGVIQWKKSRRRYMFFPMGATSFDALCLREITEEIESLMQKKKEHGGT